MPRFVKEGITQKQLAERLQVTDGAVSKWERGVNYPDLSLLVCIAVELDTNMISLLALETSSADQILRTITDLSAQERGDLMHQLRFWGYYKLFLEFMILAAFLLRPGFFGIMPSSVSRRLLPAAWAALWVV